MTTDAGNPSSSPSSVDVAPSDSDRAYNVFHEAIESGIGIEDMDRQTQTRLWRAVLGRDRHRRRLRAAGTVGCRQGTSAAHIDAAIEESRARAEKQFRRLGGKLFVRSSDREVPWPHLLPPVVISTEARLIRLWSDELAVASLWHERIGWVEIDVPTAALPVGATPQSRFPITIFADEQGRIWTWAIEANVHVISPSEPPPHPLRPREPTDWDNPSEVARYRKELENLFGPRLDH
jgi:hypothetical protein